MTDILRDSIAASFGAVVATIIGEWLRWLIDGIGWAGRGAAAMASDRVN